MRLQIINTVRCRSGGHHVSLKAPTSVLIRPDGRTLEAFGYEAEDRYAKLADDGKHKDYYYFKLFKMLLYDKLVQCYGVFFSVKGTSQHSV